MPPLYVVSTATEEMGKYAGTRWPMEGTFTRIDRERRLTYDAKTWTAGSENTETIHHTNDLTLTGHGRSTSLVLDIAVTEIRSGPQARLAVTGMKWGYKSQLDGLQKVLVQRYAE